MGANQVSFVAFQEQDNLGVGYLGAVLMQNDIEIKIIDFRMGRDVILDQLLTTRPVVVGFSIIFQYHIQDFKDLIGHLRRNGVEAHFSAGGHYPSLRYQELLPYIPELDSIVLYEGEQTFLELVQSISEKEPWQRIHGLAYRGENDEIITNPLRPLATNLDQLPPPVRPPLKTYALGRKYATLVASRGCLYDCSYCSIREFYARPEGKLKRYRGPEWVVKEMALLHEEKGCSLFMFQDDDFPVAGPNAKAWATEFCDRLEDSGLSRKIMIKINCRPDEIDPDLFRRLINCGLFLAYIGLESGTDEGLRLMNKHTTAQTNLDAVTALKQLGVIYDYGFMLFDPSSTFDSILANLDFLEKIGSDGSSPITFCKMLPYAGTKIEAMLIKEGRLQGRQGFMNYAFKEPRLNRFYDIVFDCFETWISDREGLLNLATWIRYYTAVFRKYHHNGPEIERTEEQARQIIVHSNGLMIETLRKLCSRVQSSGSRSISAADSDEIKSGVLKVQRKYEAEIKGLMTTVEEMASR